MNIRIRKTMFAMAGGVAVSVGLAGVAQAQSTSLTMALAAVGTYLILKIVNAVFPLRVDEEEEDQGLDLTQHGEQAYND